MPRGKKIIIDRKIDDKVVEELKSLNLFKIKDVYEGRQNTISSSLANVFNEAQALYQKKELNSETLEKKGLYTIPGAYELLRQNGFELSFRAFCGRVERATVPSVKIGNKRYLSIDSINTMSSIREDFYSVKDAYEAYKKFDTNLKYRAFIGRIEKRSVPSVKIGTKRLVPRDAIDALTHVARSYYTVSQAIQKLHKAGISIRRNAFERRLDRNRIPHTKIAGRRFIPMDVVAELIDKENDIRQSK